MSTSYTTKRMYEFIKGVIASTGEAPTIHELGRRFDMNSTGSVHYHLKRMEALGWVVRSRKWRGTRIVDQERKEAA